jgi:GGDEF domain-containing protein
VEATVARWTRFVIGNRKKVLAGLGAPARAVREVDAEQAVLERSGFIAATQRALADGESRGMVVVALGVDHLGLDGGADAVIVAAESRIARAIRPGDVIGRLDRARLAVLACRDDESDGAPRIAERVADRLTEPFHIAGREVEPGVQIGTASADDGRAEALIRQAEDSLATVREERA